MRSFVKDHPTYVIARTWSSYLDLLNIDLLQIWKNPDTEKWHDVYLGHPGIMPPEITNPKHWSNMATVFDDKEYAESVAVIMESRWPQTKFNVIEIPKGWQ